MVNLALEGFWLLVPGSFLITRPCVKIQNRFFINLHQSRCLRKFVGHGKRNSIFSSSGHKTEGVKHCFLNKCLIICKYYKLAQTFNSQTLKLSIKEKSVIKHVNTCIEKTLSSDIFLCLSILMKTYTYNDNIDNNISNI